MRFTVGGEEYDFTRSQVTAAMRDVVSEPIQKHLVEIDGRVFPPKQVFATLTGRSRASYTTMEAQRVLRRLGFVCREASDRDKSAPASGAVGGDDPDTGVQDRLASIEVTLATLEAAVAGLHSRVKGLETER